MPEIPIAALAFLLVPYIPLAVALSVVDLREHRLPNRLVGALAGCTLISSLLCAALWPSLRAGFLTALLLAALAAVLGLAVALIAPVLIGMGDAKTAPSVVLICAMLGWDVLLGALLGIALLGGAVGTLVLVTRRDASARFAYGPVLLAGPLLGIVLAPVLRGALGVP